MIYSADVNDALCEDNEVRTAFVAVSVRLLRYVFYHKMTENFVMEPMQ